MNSVLINSRACASHVKALTPLGHAPARSAGLRCGNPFRFPRRSFLMTIHASEPSRLFHLQRIPVKLTHSQHVESSCGILHEKVSE